MTTYVDMQEDESGDLVNIDYYCCAECYEVGTNKPSTGKQWPGGSETNYDVYCANLSCKELMWYGLERTNANG